MSYKIAEVKFNNGNGTVLCNMCQTMLVDRCCTQTQIDCAHLCEKCWDRVAAGLSGDARDTAYLAMRVQELEEFVQFIATDYVELSHDKVLWQRNDYIKRAKKLAKNC